VLLAGLGVPTRYAHSEVGVIDGRESDGLIWEQHEIELGLAPLPVAADAVVLTRWVIENLAQRHGYLCSFDPVVKADTPATGCTFTCRPGCPGSRCPSSSLTGPSPTRPAG